MVFNNKIYPLTHDLYTTLKDCAEIDRDFLELGGKCKFLTAYYIESRYPTGVDEFTRDEAEDSLDAAYFIIEFVNRKIEEKKEEGEKVVDAEYTVEDEEKKDKQK